MNESDRTFALRRAHSHRHSGPSLDKSQSEHAASNSKRSLLSQGNTFRYSGEKTAEALKVLYIVNTVTGPTPPPPSSPPNTPLDTYPDIDKGIGKLKHHRVTVHIDKGVPPVARKHSRVPFHLRDKVEKALETLEEQDILEKVTGPTTLSHASSHPQNRKIRQKLGSVLTCATQTKLLYAHNRRACVRSERRNCVQQD